MALALLCAFILVIFSGCSVQSEPLFWEEAYGQFYTNDLDRAQAEIPFTILLPTCIPGEQQDSLLPQIEGTLHTDDNEDEVEVIVRYVVYLSGDITGHVFVTERNSPFLPPDPEFNPDYEYLEIGGKNLVRTEGNFPLGPGIIYYFSHDPIYFFVETYNIPAEEAMKIVESMIEQIE